MKDLANGTKVVVTEGWRNPKTGNWDHRIVEITEIVSGETRHVTATKRQFAGKLEFPSALVYNGIGKDRDYGMRPWREGDDEAKVNDDIALAEAEAQREAIRAAREAEKRERWEAGVAARKKEQADFWERNKAQWEARTIVTTSNTEVHTVADVDMGRGKIETVVFSFKRGKSYDFESLTTIEIWQAYVFYATSGGASSIEGISQEEIFKKIA